MTELAKWTMILKNWRERNGYITPEWVSYVRAINIQCTFFEVAWFIVGVGIGLYIGMRL